MKVIIDIEDGLSVIDSVAKVSYVIGQGYVSEAAGIDHFCWCTSWKDGVVVQTRRKRTAGSADSFLVYQMKE